MEYAPHDEPANQVHTIYRDPTNDYGRLDEAMKRRWSVARFRPSPLESTAEITLVKVAVAPNRFAIAR